MGAMCPLANQKCDEFLFGMCRPICSEANEPGPQSWLSVLVETHMMEEPLSEEALGGKGVQIAQIGHHAGDRIDRTREADLDDVVVPVAVRVIALAIGVPIGLRAQCLAVKPM